MVLRPPAFTPNVSRPSFSMYTCRSKLVDVPVFALPKPMSFPPVVLVVLNQSSSL